MLFFFFNDTATTEIYTLSLHDALPISDQRAGAWLWASAHAVHGGDLRSSTELPQQDAGITGEPEGNRDRKSTRLNSSHANISYAVFCLKKKKKIITKMVSLY